MYYEFRASTKVEYGIIDYPRFGNRTSFTIGEEIKEKLTEPLEFPADTTKDNPPTDFTEMVIPVMSDKLLEALKKAGVDNLQSFKAVLKNKKTGESWDGYNAVNIVGCISCADLKQSEYAEIGGGLLDFTWLVIDPKRAKGKLLFRLAEDPSTIIAHKSVGDYLFDPKHSKLTGFMFYPADAADVAKIRAELKEPLPL